MQLYFWLNLFKFNIGINGFLDGIGSVTDQFVVIRPIVGRFEDFFNVIEKNKIANDEPFRWVGRRVIRLSRNFGLAKEPSGIVGKDEKSIVVHAVRGNLSRISIYRECF